jgi:hypothetical protein
MPLMLFLLPFVAACLPADAEPYDSYVELLARFKVQPDVNGIKSYLGSITDPKRAAQVAALVAQLGDADYSKREAATRELLLMPSLAIGQLREAAKARDLEIRYRARMILDKIEEGTDKQDQLLYAALRTAQSRQLKGLADEVLKVFPLCGRDFLRDAARQALSATARKEDADLLRSVARSADPAVRGASILALGKALQVDAAQELKEFLGAEDPDTRLAAAHALADIGDRACLGPLVAFLDSDRLDVRWQAIRVLWAATGKRFTYVPYDTPENRRAAAKAWGDWIASEGQTAQLQFPLQLVQPESGRTLVCLQNENRVVEFDITGKEVWSAPVNRPWACQGLPDGHRLIASYNGRGLFEYDAEGKLVWQKQGLPAGPSSVQRLPNGNTLVACTDSQLVLEIKPNGETGWQLRLDGRPFHALRLENGNTLVTLHAGKRVAEVDINGKQVWQLGGFQDPQCAHRLPNGNTLVADHGQRKVLQYDGDGKLVWSRETAGNVFDVQRLTNGNTLVAETSGVYEISPDGTVVWEKKLSPVSRACRY